MKKLLAIFIIFTLILTLTFYRNKPFIDVVTDSLSLDTQSSKTHNELFKEPRNYLFVKEAIQKIEKSNSGNNQTQALTEIQNLFATINAIPKDEHDITYLSAYTYLLEKLAPIKKNTPFTIAIDDGLVDRVMSNEKEFYQKLISALKISSEVKDIYMQRISLYLDSSLDSFKKGKAFNVDTLLAQDRAHADINQIPTLITLEILKTLYLDKIFDLSQASKIKASYLVMLSLASIDRVLDRYREVLKGY